MLRWWLSLILGNQFSFLLHYLAANKPDAHDGIQPRVIRMVRRQNEAIRE